MVAGLGIDIIEVDRIAQRINSGNGFRQMVFSAAEIAYCEKQAHSYQHYAARFAAKEAFFKALGTGWVGGTSFNEVEIVHDAQGCPQIQLHGETAQTLAALNISRILVSLSHIKTMATAVVIIEK